MRLRAFFANLLSDVPSLQTFDQLSSKQERNQHRGDRSIGRAKSDVLENVQRLYEIPILIFKAAIDQFVKDVIDHLFCGTDFSLWIFRAENHRLKSVPRHLPRDWKLLLERLHHL